LEEIFSNIAQMNSFIDNTYWIAIAHLPRWQTDRINRLIIQIIHEKKLSWAAFFDCGRKGWKELFAFSEKELTDIEDAKNDLPRLAFIAEQLQSEGFHLIPINSSEYPAVLKENLRTKSAPPVLYIKGLKGLLHEDAVAIIGSRSAGKEALLFTDHIARKCVSELKVVVSGFAKGVDKQALDSTLEAHGKSIIVLPQGILTFQSGFKKYYEQIVNGELLVMSTFFPKAGWEVGLAMARNIFIYGMAKEIFVAESDSKGGTWEGAIDGLNRHRKIFVRNPSPNEKNANLRLMELGAVPLNIDGTPVPLVNNQSKELFPDQISLGQLKEQDVNYNSPVRNTEKEILNLLSKGSYSVNEIILALRLGWNSRKLTGFLKKHPDIKIINGKPSKYVLNDAITPSLF
jgi:predicted Rossmann fold nucleotide-binding protein DprA/Smf involved in DNA uptake